ncbi:related to TOK1 - Voltage-gated, outward-rectifying K+ channel protein of the plasma membrane [Melanopsichium pennsylvanicum]|uniref:Related to TOK1 - Voltage-gated, outward-rectifying K+ channel protein of the plasma membrane n=2 Tax=Melanopsichium pennsylvanicum TaxID=63383 RepID=A0AAJ4XQU5_9BASI|nr:related to TOK1-Voltage-gated, outward-rectifying K channel protein of the plasma membrane [Melanopsichium pennsylvanicum 4]SNX85403.1 related to TOK1 - Voltage-gated, outward-rectifying K+ channel protein of the plasma membrane [Melanopsichium pennsylvanicum]
MISGTEIASNKAAMPHTSTLLPNAASLQPTHVTSHLPSTKSLQNQHRTARPRSPFRHSQQIQDSRPTQTHIAPIHHHKSPPRSSTLHTFLTVTDVPHYGHVSRASRVSNRRFASHHEYDHSTDCAHGLRVRKTPIFSGLLAPFSIVLEVPGLTSKWYAKIDQDGIVQRFIDNPPILTVGLAISLGAAVVANGAIICRFLEVLRPRQSIALATAGFVLHDLINVVALATFGGIYGPKHDGLSLSAAYWMVCASTITSTLVTISLIADYVRTNDFRHAGSGLTQLQKGLVLAGMGLFLYLSLGSLIFVFVIKIDFITALYFSTATVLTVGFGDVVPTSPGGKVLVILYAPVGIVLVALVVSSARNTILETFQAALLARTKERRRRVAEKRAIQKEHKRQDRALRKIVPRTFTFGSGGAAEAGNNVAQSNDFAEALARMEKQAAGRDHVQQDAHASGGAKASSVDHSNFSDHTGATKNDHEADASLVDKATAGNPDVQREISNLQHQLLAAKQRTEEDFRRFEERSRHEAFAAARMKLFLAASLAAAFWLLGAVAFTYAERWSYGGAMWFCFIAMITIGYGDYHPSTQLGRAIFVIWGLLGVAVLTILLAVVQDAFGGVLHRMLTNSTSRLFDRAESRAKKRRLKKTHDAHATADDEGDAEGVAANRVMGGPGRRRRRPQRKSTGDIARLHPRTSHAAVEMERKSMEARVEPSARTDSPSPIELEEFSNPSPVQEAFAISPFELEATNIEESDTGTLFSNIRLSLSAAAKVENTLVSTPQKLALAALQTFQHSIRVLLLHETAISQAMTDVPALRHYYNSRQHFAQDESDDKRGFGMDPEIALQALQASIRQMANPEYEKVAKMIVANCEFEHHLRVLLDEFQGLKDSVEGFKHTQLLRRSRTMSVSEIRANRNKEESSQDTLQT